jgi:hypothetical protein
LDYCNQHQPCDFVIFAAGNPYTGTGTCWLYPGESFDESQGSTSGCDNPYLSVYDDLECEGVSTPTTSSGACAATASPSAIASVCGYAPPDDDCFSDCFASSGAASCLSLCAEADACSYAVFNPNNPSNSPYADGNCWVYADGTFDEGAVTDCSGDPEQYVYTNVCPKPSTTSSTASSATESPAGSDGSDAASGDDGDDEEDAASASAVLSLTSLMVVGLAMLF